MTQVTIIMVTLITVLVTILQLQVRQLVSIFNGLLDGGLAVLFSINRKFWLRELIAKNLTKKINSQQSIHFTHVCSQTKKK